MIKNRVSLHKEIYDSTAIMAAAKEYSPIAHIKVEEARNYYICSFTNCKYEGKRTIMEFCNFVIDLMNCRQGLD